MWKALSAAAFPRLVARPLNWGVMALAQRGIITVVPHTPAEASRSAARDEYFREVTRAEDIAMSQFNRAIRGELERKAVPGGPRSKRRYGYFKRPSHYRVVKGAPKEQSPTIDAPTEIVASASIAAPGPLPRVIHACSLPL